MSDIEDGEVVSSDDEKECRDKESMLFIKNDTKQIKDNSFWNFEQTNIKSDNGFTSEQKSKHSSRYFEIENVTSSESKNCNKDGFRHQKRCESNDQNSARVSNHNEHIDNKRKRKFDHLTEEHVGSNQNEIVPPKRRLLCKYYASGDCKNGSTCYFMHSDFPCKFFHDENAICRAGDHCKFSHSELSDEMKVVLYAFIHEGKEKIIPTNDHAIANITSFSKDSFIVTIPPRPKCLLPTPMDIKPRIIPHYNSDFNDSYQTNDDDFKQDFFEEEFYASYHSYNDDFSDTYDSYNHNYDIKNRLYNDNQNYLNYNTDNAQCFKREYEYNRDIPNYPIANISHYMNNFKNIPEINHNDQNNRNKSQIEDCDFRNIEFSESTPIFQRALHNINNLDKINTCYKSDDEVYFNESLSLLNEENFIPQTFTENVHSSYTSIQNQINYKNRAPARFIVGNSDNCVKVKKETQITSSFDMEYKDALKLLAEKIVYDPQRRSPSLDKFSLTENSNSCKAISEIDTLSIHKNIKTEASEVRIDENVSIFKNENEMSESERQYIEEMKSLINLDAQFKSVIPWKLKKLHPTKNLPYSSINFKIEDIHDNPSFDPRLQGHSLLTLFIKKEGLSSDEEDYESLLQIKEKVDQIDTSGSCLFTNLFKKGKII